MTRGLRQAGNFLLPPAAEGNVWTGLRRQPQQALVVQSPDLHHERAEALRAVLEVVAPVPCILTPPVPRHPWRLEVRQEDAPAVHAALSALPPHWEVCTDRQSGGAIARPHLAIDGRALEVHPELAVRVDVLRRTPEGYLGKATGSLNRVEACSWEEIADRSLREENRQPAAPAPQMPIDAVYTWVDGADPAWQQRRDHALGELTRRSGTAELHRSATDASRYEQTEELRGSLRSLHRYANWVRTIHIVTDGQVPAWLQRDHPRIRIVDHRELLGGSRFNSHAIESALHRIPGLAAHYLYLNDDVFFGRIAHPGDFFAAEGVARFFPSDLPIDPGPASAADTPIMAAAKNGRDLMAQRFALRVRTRIRHTVHPQLRSIGEQIEAEQPEAVSRTRAAPFRCPADISVASSLHHWYAYAQGRAVPTQPIYLYVDLDRPDVGQVLDALESLRRYDTFCLNREQAAPAAARSRQELQRFMDRYFPGPAPWETAVPSPNGPAPRGRSRP